MALFLLIGCAGCTKEKKEKVCEEPEISIETDVKPSKDELIGQLEALQHEYAQSSTAAYLECYVEDVINNGSSDLDYPYGDMQAGFASSDDAASIASYVVTLSGRTGTRPELIPEGNMLYNGNCGGCHGDDGKGLNGAFPDLTLETMEGIEKRRERFKEKIATLKEQLAKL